MILMITALVYLAQEFVNINAEYLIILSFLIIFTQVISKISSLVVNTLNKHKDNISTTIKSKFEGTLKSIIATKRHKSDEIEILMANLSDLPINNLKLTGNALRNKVIRFLRNKVKVFLNK